MKDKNLKLKEIIKRHILNNQKEYIIAILIFIIGIFLGVFLVNNLQENQKTEVKNYISSFIEEMKQIEKLDSIDLLKTSCVKNIIFATILWFFGTTVIGIPIVFGLVLYKGFCFGYTISICVATMGITRGLSFVLINLLFPSLLLIPAILAIAVSRI